MQVVSPFFSNKSSIKSTTDIQDSSLSSPSSSNSDYDDTIFNSHKNINDAVVNYGTLYKTAASPAYTVNSNLILRTENQEFNNFGYSSSYFHRNPNLMHDDNKMAGTNSKRYLHNKLGDRKRRRPDSAFSGSSEMEESVLVDTLARPKQTTRQSAQRHLTPVPNSLEKSNRTEQSVSACGSKKYLRSKKQDTEQCCDYIECSPTNLNKVGVENVSHSDVDINSTTCKVNSDSLKIKVDKFENDESLKDVENTHFKDLVEKKHISNKKDDNEQNETKQINNLEVKTNDKNDNNSDSNKSSPKFYQSDASQIDNYNALGCQNRNDSNNVFTINATNLIAESLDEAVNPICKLEDKSSLGDNDKNDTIEANNETNNFTTACIRENVSPISPRPPLCTLNEDNETQDNYEDHLHHISNSLCLENSLSSNSCCKVSMEHRENICDNESKPELDTNETKLSNLTMNLSQTDSKTPQQECDVSRTQRGDEHCPNFIQNDDNTGHSIKTLPTLSTYNITKLCAQKSGAPCNSFEDNAIEDDLGIENVAYRKDVDNMQEKKDIGQFINTEEPQNINVDKNYNNTDSSLENNSVKDGGDNNTPKADVEFKEAQPTAIHSNHQQLENDIIEAADKVYTQIEEHYHHHQQQNVTPISSDYEQIIANHQQQSRQQDHEERRQSHNLNLTHQQDSPQQHSIHQQQQPYSNSQLYQLQQQNNHQQLHLQHQHQIHKQIELQQHHHNISQNTQRESGQQEHSHLMEFLHPQHHSSNNIQSPLHQQQHQIHEVYHDLMMDEFHEEHHTPYKL